MLWSLVLLPCLCCPRSKHVQRRVRSLLADSPSARPCGRSFAPLGCSFRAAPVASLRLLLLDDRDLSPVVHVSLCSLTYFCMYSILGHILRVSTPSQPSVLIQSDCALSMACAPSVSCETTAACFISNSTSGYSSSDTLCNIHDRVMFHRCGVDCGRQGKCIQPNFNVRLNSCCRFFTGSLSCLQAASSTVLSGRFSFTQAYHHDSLLSF